jgi:alpha-1,6-mannosyltransferase
VVVTSDYAREEFQDVADAAGCPVVRVPLGVDLDTFRPHPRDPEEGLRLVHAGRLSREKSPHLAVATAVELHRRGVPLRMDVYGVGPHLDELVDVAGGAPVRFRGYVDSPARLSRALAHADIALSVCPGETFGLAVLEALASGTPVVTADRGGARELVDADSGAWGEPDPAALADAVLELAGRAVAARRAAARRRAERYPWSTTVASMLEVHSSVAMPASRSRARRVTSSSTAAAAATSEPITIAR